MTLSTTLARASFAGDGATTVFPFSFKIWAASDLGVYLRDDSSGADTAQTLGADYSVAVAAYPGTGNVLFF